MRQLPRTIEELNAYERTPQTRNHGFNVYLAYSLICIFIAFGMIFN